MSYEKIRGREREKEGNERDKNIDGEKQRVRTMGLKFEIEK